MKSNLNFLKVIRKRLKRNDQFVFRTWRNQVLLEFPARSITIYHIQLLRGLLRHHRYKCCSKQGFITVANEFDCDTKGNIIIMSVIMSLNELKKSSTNMIIFNLAISDFLISIIVVTFMLAGKESVYNMIIQYFEILKFVFNSRSIRRKENLPFARFNVDIFIKINKSKLE